MSSSSRSTSQTKNPRRSSPERVSCFPRPTRSRPRRKWCSSPTSHRPANSMPSPGGPTMSRNRPMLVAPPSGTTAMPCSARSTPRRSARVSTATWSLTPSTRTTRRICPSAARARARASCSPELPAAHSRTALRRRDSLSTASVAAVFISSCSFCAVHFALFISRSGGQPGQVAGDFTHPPVPVLLVVRVNDDVGAVKRLADLAPDVGPGILPGRLDQFQEVGTIVAARAELAHQRPQHSLPVTQVRRIPHAIVVRVDSSPPQGLDAAQFAGDPFRGVIELCGQVLQGIRRVCDVVTRVVRLPTPEHANDDGVLHLHPIRVLGQHHRLSGRLLDGGGLVLGQRRLVERRHPAPSPVTTKELHSAPCGSRRLAVHQQQFEPSGA